ncbi:MULTISPECIES: DNA phosphorothioation-dependent restriction protein DptF [unclassified Exiguobacterium]|uniref:DNA phosphorothioation-dependent restriction protein DptF n=1 Tax=unclassified Exiguobacterium TaxID=2644629 RepID=UPI001BEB640F|nr:MULTISPECIES: DNA phosphorothioation-dependent restriction protein DptF [unclassified Exiguobacterium]
MNTQKIWSFLVTNLVPEEDTKFTYEEFKKWMTDSPTEAMVYLDGIFQSLTLKRMHTLANSTNRPALSERYFERHVIKLGWQKLKVELNASMKELKWAHRYIELSNLYTKRNLLRVETVEAFEKLICLAEVYLNETTTSSHLHDLTKEETPINYVEENEKELIITTEPSTEEIHEQTPEEETVENDVSVMEPLDSETHSSKENILIGSGISPLSINRNTTTSKLLEKLKMLQSSSKESVVNADSFGEFREYMHIDRPIQHSLIETLEKISHESTPQLILLSGSVGDGKSHLLAFIKEKHPHLVEDFRIHNDSTESFDPSKNSIETLDSVLASFYNQESKTKHLLIAINLGVLHNFYNFAASENRYDLLRNFIDNSDIFGNGERIVFSSKSLHLLNIAGYQTYSLGTDGAQSVFFSNILEKVVSPSSDNPFYSAYRDDINRGTQSIIHDNYDFLSNPAVRKSVENIVIQIMVKEKLIISTRAFYNFIFDILVPPTLTFESDNPNAALPNLIFGHPDRSNILNALHRIDPLSFRINFFDQLITKYVLAQQPQDVAKDALGDMADVYRFIHHPPENVESMNALGSLLIRSYSLLNPQEIDQPYLDFLNYLNAYYVGDGENLGALFGLIRKVMYLWRGSPRENYLYIDGTNNEYRVAYPFQAEEIVDDRLFASSENKESDFYRFSPFIRLGFEVSGKEILFDLDYKLYILLVKIKDGYRPNRSDLRDAVQFVDFYEELIRYTDKSKSILLVSTHNGSMVELTKPNKFSKSKFEVRKVKQ